MKQCLFCNNDFNPTKPKQKFCSDKCRVYFNREDVSEGGFIYCLRNPLNKNEIFYVGKTIVSLNKRINGHLSESKKKDDKKSSIIRNILAAGEDVIIEQIEVVSCDTITETEKILKEREDYWIKKFSEDGDLTNYQLNEKSSRAKKTNPIGVRFNEELLNKLKEADIAKTPQKALNVYEKSYVELLGLKIEENNKPENKKRIIKEREGKQNLVEDKTKNTDNDMPEELVNQIIAIQTQPKPSFVPIKNFKSYKQKQIDELMKNHKKQ